MKTCLLAIFFTFSHIFIQSTFLIVSLMGVFLWKSTIFHCLTNSDYGATAKCIHDKLPSPFSAKSPQQYGTKVGSPSSNSELIIGNPATSSPNGVDMSQPKHYNEYDQYQFLGSQQPKQYASKSLLESNFVTDGSSLSVSAQLKKERLRRSIDNEYYGNVLDDESNSFNEELNTDTEYLKDSQSDISDVDLLFKPIRLKVWCDYSHISSGNDTESFRRLKTSLDRAVELIGNILSVIRVQGSLLFSRHDICDGYWSDGTAPNRGKCRFYDPHYDGETCTDDFQIPDEHLEGFQTFDRIDSQPKIYFKNGTGVPDADVVIYIRSTNTRKCRDKDIVAYAAYCQLDQFNRPVAGFANFCPDHLSSDKFDSEKFYLTVLHEFFHILGFSQKLFDKFQDCKKTFGSQNQNLGQALVCEDKRNTVDFSNEWYRILSQAVVSESNKHFNCSDMGGPLEGNYENEKESSHWEARYLQPSIMTASMGLAHLTVIDRITLALFQDTGWYQVDMSQAGDLTWGKDAGCEFGRRSYCHSGHNPYFCNASEVVRGCHYLHLDKGVCETNKFLDSCTIYKADPGSECWKTSNNVDPAESNRNGEVYTVNSRCFISNLSNDLPQESDSNSTRTKRSIPQEGRCYEHRCNDTRTLEIRVRGSEWVVCPYNKWVKIPGYEGSIRCPSALYMCNAKLSSSNSKTGSQSCATVNISFNNLARLINSSEDLVRFKEFLEKKMNEMVKKHGAVLYDMQRKRSMIFFKLKTVNTNTTHTQACSSAVLKVKDSVMTKALVISINGVQLHAIKISVKYTLRACEDDPTPNTEVPTEKEARETADKKMPPGIIAATTVGIVCVGVFASVGFVVYWKSTIPRSIGPATASEVQVSYHPNRQSSFATGSDGGSVGQIEFPV